MTCHDIAKRRSTLRAMAEKISIIRLAIDILEAERRLDLSDAADAHQPLENAEAALRVAADKLDEELRLAILRREHGYQDY